MNFRKFSLSIQNTRKLGTQTYKLIKKMSQLERGRKHKRYNFLSKKIGASKTLYVVQCLLHTKNTLVTYLEPISDPVFATKISKLYEKLDRLMEEINTSSGRLHNQTLKSGSVAPVLTAHTDVFRYLKENKLNSNIKQPLLEWHDGVMCAVKIWDNEIDAP